ncbi:MAG: hypothetical protein AAGI30_11795 [Planctomycetota bacterium]
MMIARTSALLALFAFGASSALGQTFTLTGDAESFVQDLDSGDGFDIGTNYRNTDLTITFRVPGPGSLIFDGNRQNQGGSLTDYLGPQIIDLTIVGGAESLNLDAVDEPIDAVLSLWDRASFGPGEQYYDIDFQIGSSRIGFSFRARPDDPAFNQMFNVGTPEPNTVFDSFIPIGTTVSFFSSNYRGADVDFDVFAAEFGGRGRFGYQINGVVLVEDFAPGDINGSFESDAFDLASFLDNPTDFNDDSTIDGVDVTDLIAALGS